MCLLLARFWKTEKGVTAIEFSVVAPLFLIFVFSIMEYSALFYTRARVETATHNVSRFAMTEASVAAGNRAVNPDNPDSNPIYARLQAGIEQAALLNGTMETNDCDIDSDVYTTWRAMNRGRESFADVNWGGTHDWVRYRVTCTYNFLTPFGALASAFYDGTLDNSVEFTSTAFVINE